MAFKRQADQVDQSNDDQIDLEASEQKETTLPTVESIVVDGKKYSRRRIAVWSFILLLLLIAASGAIAYLYLQLRDQKAQLNSQQAEISALKEENGDLKAAPENTTDTSSELTKKEKIEQSASRYAQLTTGDYKSFTYRVVESSEAFARVEYGDPQADSAYVMLLKKTAGDAIGDESWVVIWSGETLNDADKADLKARFDVPDSFLD